MEYRLMLAHVQSLTHSLTNMIASLPPPPPDPNDDFSGLSSLSPPSPDRQCGSSSFTQSLTSMINSFPLPPRDLVEPSVLSPGPSSDRQRPSGEGQLLERTQTQAVDETSEEKVEKTEKRKADWEAHVPEDNDDEADSMLAICWNDAVLAITKAPWENEHLAAPAGGCEHEYIFKDTVGTVCEFCGVVKLSIRDTFEFRRPKRLRRGYESQKSKKTEDAPTISAVGPRPASARTTTELGVLKLAASCEERMYPHQKEGFKFLCQNLLASSPGGTILAHAPGTGKTFVVVCFLQSYLSQYRGKRVLVSTPKTILQHWSREMSRWETTISVDITLHVLGHADDRDRMIRSWFKDGGVLLVSLNRFQKYSEDEGESGRMLLKGADVLVVDEAHNARTDGSKIVAALDKVDTKRRIFLSGTLFQNSFDELFSTLKLCRPDFLLGCPEYEQFVEKKGGNFTKFIGSMILNENADFDDEEVSDAVMMLRKITAPFISWNGGGELYKTLPELLDFLVVLNMSEQHSKVVNHYLETAAITGFISKDQKATAACIHPCLASDEMLTEGQDPRDGVKTWFVMELVRYCWAHRKKAIVFSQRLAALKLIKDMAHRCNLQGGIEVLLLDGATSGTARQQMIDDFNGTKRPALMLASIKACGEGISLISATRVVILEPEWNPSTVKQAVCRAYRLGQRKKVYVYRLLAGESEMVKEKRSLRKAVLTEALFNPSVDALDLISRLRAADRLSSAQLDLSRTGDDFLDAFVHRQPDCCAAVYRHRREDDGL